MMEKRKLKRVDSILIRAPAQTSSEMITSKTFWALYQRRRKSKEVHTISGLYKEQKAEYIQFTKMGNSEILVLANLFSYPYEIPLAKMKSMN